MSRFNFVNVKSNSPPNTCCEERERVVKVGAETCEQMIPAVARDVGVTRQRTFF